VTRRILVTSALPYANGAIHLGHLLEYIQTDIWVAFQKMQGHQVHYVCADDTHGTPVMLRAEKEGLTPQALIARVSQEHQRDFAGFGVRFDHYHSTDAPENRAICETIYKRLRDAGLIQQRAVEQFYDPVKAMFLPDRFIKGECPKCGAKDQYGDSCEACGATYQPTELKNAYSTVSGAAPVRKSSEHYFFKLSDPRCESFLRDWTQSADRLQPEAANKMKEWLGEAGSNKLADWDISRDAPYFGFEIPDAPGKYFYVWLDAPVGYFASFTALAQRLGIDANAYFKPGSDCEMVHFIGKDILYFHALFWPAMLQFAGFRTPTRINAHGFLTVDGAKMSKSRGTFITAESYLKQGMNPEWLRYYFAAKLNSSMEDLDLNFADFTARINSDLVGKFVNIASRSAGFLSKRFGGELADVSDHALVQTLRAGGAAIAAHFDAREFGKAIRDIMALTDQVNAYVDQNKPWELARQDGQDNALQQVCSVCLESFRILSIYLKPVLPVLVQQVEQLLNVPSLTWADAAQSLPHGHRISAFNHLMQRVDPEQIKALIAANQDSLKASASDTAKAVTEFITIEDFNKVDLRMGRVLSCQTVEGSTKLLQLSVDVGEARPRNIFSGISAHYSPDQMTGKMVVVVANLAPRKMKFGISEGMVLCASPEDDSSLFVLSADAGCKPGMKVS
jgi:methionyl-tRNA synthetase